MQDNTINLGFEHFVGQADIVTKSLFIILLFMSLISWFIIFLKIFQGVFERSRAHIFLKQFWNAPSIQTVKQMLSKRIPNNYYEVLTDSGIRSIERYKRSDISILKESGSLSDVITRALSAKLDEINLRCENGVMALAAIAATAPFVGLFGTVWGIYHALIEIGATGAGTIDKVAGPVGEALIMTAVGLAVAIPAALAHSWISRRNQITIGHLDAFAYELLGLLEQSINTSIEIKEGEK